ncbi:hypothetical protein N7523_008870 [Penicillium sp. IBT 18751x]|nr:hypothetical protein N7523_008870 [Penicillium sp. IBT 18751x]
MHFMNILVALVVSTPLIAAAPTREKTLQSRGCPNGWAFCGCTSQSGAGDGAICGSSDYLEGPYTCPGN